MYSHSYFGSLYHSIESSPHKTERETKEEKNLGNTHDRHCWCILFQQEIDSEDSE